MEQIQLIMEDFLDKHLNQHRLEDSLGLLLHTLLNLDGNLEHLLLKILAVYLEENLLNKEDCLAILLLL